ncbi:uncharacterized protein BCR38DRAFT_341079 [Pseudomassariella vexata]|uniref:SET domain-containing protein n=1 Tax=Pseudomassariella vexata TaxID=1141098 RepID=A0A1Y2E211_9PEZI|nr:uncharacterized protein BCR38DRAFT_341079 [Pseudomassariella vexata]ORY64905.1 hypothetical protein BCR38DRAFT_341079 [Pseudomassariella vexata]
MTEKFLSLSTHIVAPSQTTALSPKSNPSIVHHVSNKVEMAEEEPYTIKCICNYSDDDGNTIYCETCDTWQHIECFYPHNIQDAYREDFAHSCADCKPRLLDRQRAIERQRLRHSKPTTEGVSEKKPKRPPSKSHKKKVKPNDLQLNGHSGSDSNTKHNDHTLFHQHKKSKSTHRPNHPISSQALKRSPSCGQKNGNPHGHPPSPATTPPDHPADLEIHDYSSAFLSLYNDDRDFQIVHSNSFASLVISNHISLWLRDREKLWRETGRKFEDVFQDLPANIDSVKRTPVVAHKKQPIADGELQWQYLTAPYAIEKDVPLVELNGQIGIQKDYCENPDNRWADLSSPLPFVFFHPMLPLYIDTRKEGSLARYVRRSCKPNAVLDTYLSEPSEYHFWLVSDRRIEPNQQITIPWDFRLPKQDGDRMLRLIGMGDDETNSQPEFDVNDLELYQTISQWLYQILSEYGGCACDLGSDCTFQQFHRHYLLRSQSQSNSSRKRPRKQKTHTISPTSTGHATNSRAPSEGNGDDGGENDSGSSRSKPPSRDMTPARQGSFDTLGILTEPTDRDKRKVAMVEDSFRRMEQQQPPRKKKRTSDGTVSSNTSKQKSRNSVSRTPGLPNGTSERRYVDAGTNRSISGSPSSATSPYTAGHHNKYTTSRLGSMPIPSRNSSEGPHPEYCDASVQTDPVDGEWFSPTRQSAKPKRRVVSLSKRLLENRHRLRADEEQRRKPSAGSPTSVTSAMIKMDLDLPSSETAQLASSGTTQGSPVPSGGTDPVVDTPMKDVPAALPSPPNIPSPAVVLNDALVVKIKSPELRVQMPPVPAFSSSNSPKTAVSATTPLSATASTVQSAFSASSLPSPFGRTSMNGIASHPAHPSPVKKKLSLSDYTKSRMNKTVAAKPVGASLKPPSIAADESKSPTNTDVPLLDPVPVDNAEP